MTNASDDQVTILMYHNIGRTRQGKWGLQNSYIRRRKLSLSCSRKGAENLQYNISTIARPLFVSDYRNINYPYRGKNTCTDVEVKGDLLLLGTEKDLPNERYNKDRICVGINTV